MVSDKKVVFIYTSLPSYMFRSIDELAKNIKCKITVIETSTNPNYPTRFKSEAIEIIKYEEIKLENFSLLFSNIQRIFISGWANKIIINLVHVLSEKNLKLCLLSDQPLKNNLRQFIGKYKLRSFLKKFDYAIVSGEKALELLEYYGFSRDNIKVGLYSCDNNAFNRAKVQREISNFWPKRFLFDGQIIKRKGIPFLLNEYNNYKNQSLNPWPLTIIGKGDLAKAIPRYIDYRGFVNPFDVPTLYKDSGCFVLTSLEDHWPLVVHQAVSAGLPILLSKFCFNKIEFLVEHKNGYIIDPLKKGSLADAMLKIEKSTNSQLRNMGEFSFELSKKFSVDKWVKLFKNIIEN